MKAIYEKFTDEEFEAMAEHKSIVGMSWHDYLVRISEYAKNMRMEDNG